MTNGKSSWHLTESTKKLIMESIQSEKFVGKRSNFQLFDIET